MEMMDYIKEQPALFKKILDSRKDIAAPFIAMAGANHFTHMYLIASGTSYNGADAALKFIERVLDVEVKVVASSQDVEYFTSNPLLIYISQGGNSTNTINAIKRDRAYCQLSLTANPGCEVNKISKYIEIPCGVETAGPKTKGYTSTILVLYIMALEFALNSGTIKQNCYDEYISVLYEAAGNMEENIRGTIAFTNRNVDELKGMETAYIVGKGTRGIVAEEGALKIMETFLIPSLGFEFEEFMHGPACSISNRVSGFYLMPGQNEIDYERMKNLADYHRNIKSAVFTIGKVSADDGNDLIIKKTGKEYTIPFEDILLFQIISALIPPQIGLDGVGHSRFWQLDKILKIKAKRE